MRDRPIAEAARHPDGGLGFRGACGRPRPAQPGLHARTPADPVRLAGNARDPTGGGPDALAGYGVLRADTGGMALRFRDGRPAGATTEDLLGWVCRDRAAEGTTVLVRVGDNAAWHVSRRVTAWVERHNRRVRRTKAGCRTGGAGGR